MKTTDLKIKEYIGSLDETTRADVLELNQLISAHMPGIVPKMWEGVFWGGSKQKIIGYGDLTYTRSDKKKVEWFMVGLTLQKNYMSIYINATESGEYLVKKYGAELGKVKLGSSSISFKKLSDIKIDTLLELVDKSYLQLSTIN